MKRKRNFWAADTLIILLAVMCLTLAVMLSIAMPVYFIPVIVVVLVVAVFVLFGLQRTRRLLRRMLSARFKPEAAASNGVGTFNLPIMAVSDDIVVWYNDAFLKQIALGAESTMLAANKVMPGLDLRAAAEPKGQDLTLGNRCYTAHSNMMRAEKNLYFVLFIEDTQLKVQAAEYRATRPSVLYIVIDTYDEILKEMQESERAAIVSSIDKAVERFVAKSSGFLRKVSTSRYLAVLEERHMKDIEASRFSVLDEVRKIGEESVAVTLSIGVGRLGETFSECEEMARGALDMALGRGGDQAAVKSPEGFEFYGGVAHSVERRTKVKSRVVAAAIRNLFAEFDKVLIMGHKDADMDSVGAAVGMLRFCRICKKPAAIVIDTEKNMSGMLIEHLVKNGYGKDLISPQEALPLTGPRTLIVVVDTHIPYLLESDQVFKNCGASVVIDHHRKMVNHIASAQIFYHEPYASSASELVSELLQYVGDAKTDKPTPVEAEALLCGIMLDTRTFSLHVGVRTFEAAAWLRRMGAQTAVVKRMFASSMNEYLYRSHLVSEAKIHQGCAIAMSDRVPPECEVVAPQAANELLAIEGVQASFVGIEQGDVVRVSARSMGDVNVQLIMEKIGGGGHLTMAGAQMNGVSMEQAQTAIAKAISEYMSERTHDKV